MVSNRAVAVLLLFVLGIVLAGVVAALAVALADGLRLQFSPFAIPTLTLGCFIALFYMTRRFTLPVSLASPPARALAIVTAWMLTAGALAAAAAWLIRGVVWFPFAVAAIGIAALLAVLSAIERLAIRRGELRG